MARTKGSKNRTPEQKELDNSKIMKTHNLTLEYLKSLPTLHQGQTDDLKIERDYTRVWLSRLTIEDGQPYDNQVTVEKFREVTKGGKYQGWIWVTDYTYQAK